MCSPAGAATFNYARDNFAILSMFKVLVELAITLSHLLLTKLIAILLLLQYKQ